MKRHRQKLKKAKSDRKQKIKDLKEAIKDNDEISKREILKELQQENLKPIKGFYLWVKNDKYSYNGEFSCYKMEQESVTDLDTEVIRYLLRKGWKAYKTTSPYFIIIAK